ncbi:MAG: hypothetical protein KatS3mg111_2723 [Pirellulaceae bacterium]|nr:MAG: hypothetical protein KatS3mg111_2723 [Pirellulaceae bacterium]
MGPPMLETVSSAPYADNAGLHRPVIVMASPTLPMQSAFIRSPMRVLAMADWQLGWQHCSFQRLDRFPLGFQHVIGNRNRGTIGIDPHIEQS